MQVFQFRDNVATDYAGYIRSFINVADSRIRSEVEKALTKGLLWRDPLFQLPDSNALAVPLETPSEEDFEQLWARFH
jgi:hypothetical protein